MAIVKVSNISISLQKLVKNGADGNIHIPDELMESLEAYVSEVIDDPTIVVEVTLED